MTAINDNTEIINKVKQGMNFIDMFEDPIIGSMCLLEGITAQEAVEAGAILKKGLE